MSAVEQAREGLRAAYHAWWRDQTPISVVLAAEEKLIAAVRAERDAAWREGVRVEIEYLKATDKSRMPGDDWMDRNLTHRGWLAALDALAALAARMEAK